MRLIDADKLNKKKKYSFQTVFGVSPKCEFFIKADDLFRAPTVDAVPVVRCEKCIHYEMGVCLKIYDDGAASRCAWQERKPDDFCSYGERREDS